MLILFLSKPKLITTAMLDAAASSADAAARPLELEFGTLFFGYPVVPYTPAPTPPTTAAGPAGATGATGASATRGIGLSVMDSLRGGHTLSGRPTRSGTPVSVPDVVVSQPVADTAPVATAPAAGHDWGTGGNALGSARSVPVSSGGKKKKEGEKKKKKREVEVIDID